METYLLKDDAIIRDLRDAEQNPSTYFISIKDDKALQNSSIPKNENVYNGAIVMEYQGQRLMGYRNWDIVDALWARLVVLAIEILTVGKGTTEFLDQPTLIEMELIENNLLRFVLMRDDGKFKSEQVVPAREFFTALLQAAREFFAKMEYFTPTGEDVHDNLNQLESKLRKLYP